MSMIIPDIKFIILFFLVKNSITLLLFAAEINAKTNNGNPMPTPKRIKLNKLVIKLVVDVLTANKTTREAGLQGRTISPKNNPNIRELR